MSNSPPTPRPPARPESVGAGGRFRPAVVSGPIGWTLFFLALPVLGEQVLNTIVTLFDTWLAGRISPAATSAIGFAAYVGWLASMLAMLVATGTTALVARHTGAGEPREANRIANQSILLAGFLGIAIFALIYALAPWFAQQQNMTGETYAITVHYLRVDAVGHFAMSLTFVGCAAMRGAGNMRMPMLIFAAINAFNIVASLSLVYGIGPIPELGISGALIPKLGVYGIVWGTVSARIVGAVLTLIVLARGTSGLILRARDLAFHGATVRRILRIGIPAAADGAVMWVGHFLLLIVIARLASGVLGEAYYAAHMIAVRVEALTYLPAVAWGTATATMVGQSLGAGDRRRAAHAAHWAVLQCGSLSIAMAALFYFGAELVYAIMSDDWLVRAAGVTPFRTLALFQPILVASIVYIHALRGAGDTRFPMIVTLIGTFLFRVPMGYFFGITLSLGLAGGWMGMYCDMTWRAAAASLRYLRGKWLKVEV